MEGRKISFVVLAMAGLLTACKLTVCGSDDSEISTALAFGGSACEECTQNAKTTGRRIRFFKISDWPSGNIGAGD